MTDSKTMDVQAGSEKALTVATVALAGGNLISRYPGIVGSLIAQSFEGILIDNDMLGSIQRVLRGIDVNDDTLSLDVIRDVVQGPDHFLGHEQTRRLMRSEYLYPETADRGARLAWENAGSKTLYERTHERVREILSEHYPSYIDGQADSRICDRFPIRLDRKNMQPGNDRW